MRRKGREGAGRQRDGSDRAASDTWLSAAAGPVRYPIRRNVAVTLLPSMAAARTVGAERLCHRWHRPPGHSTRPDADGGTAVSDRSILRDVAVAAGVSLRTASRVLNDDPRVAPATRERVRLAMTDLSYTPDLMARSLRGGTDATIGLVVESIADPFFSELVAAVESATSDGGKSVLVASTHGDPERERRVVSELLARRVSGLLVAPTAGDHGWLAGATAPLVAVDRPADGLHDRRRRHRRPSRREGCRLAPRRPRAPGHRLHRRLLAGRHLGGSAGRLPRRAGPARHRGPGRRWSTPTAPPPGWPVRR